MKQEQLCQLCNNNFYTGTVWYMPSLDEMMSICEGCAENHIDEIGGGHFETAINNAQLKLLASKIR